MKGKGVLLALAASAVFFSAYSQTVTLPPVKVTAPKVGGGQFSCLGTACAGAVNQE